MVGLLFLILIGVGVLFYSKSEEVTVDELPIRLSDKLNELWKIAQDSLKDKKYLRAEKALLTILRVDKRNASAYNRLGILYAKQDNYKEAIECFEIAQSLDPSAANLHNIGLIYYNNDNYVKAAEAFEQSLELEDDVAVRYLAYSKVQEKLGDYHKMTALLEKAVAIDPNPQVLKQLASAYERIDQDGLAAELKAKVAKMINNQLKAEPQTKRKQASRPHLPTKRQSKKRKLIS